MADQNQHDQQQTSQPGPVFLLFSGGISYPAMKSLQSVCCNVANQGHSHLTILLNSGGGGTTDGLAIYNFMRALPIPITIHNIGAVGSIANLIFLAADTRIASPNSRFFIHDFSWGSDRPETLTRIQIQERSISLDSDRKIFRSIFDQRTSISDSGLDLNKLVDEPLVLEPSTAQKIGLIQEIADAKVPAGVPIWNIEY